MFTEWIERQALVARDLRLLYVPTPKVACTGIMWALARAEGTVAPPSFVSSRGEQSRAQTIHDPLVHGLPNLAGLDPSERETVLTDPTWTRFCVTRDPYARLLSGWLDRVLLNSADSLGDDLAFAGRAAVESGDLGASFRSFVRRFVEVPPSKLSDGHFVSQFSLLRPDLFPYTEVVELAELDAFAGRMASLDGDRRRFDPRPMNESLRVDPDVVYDAGTARLVERFYIEDFRDLGQASRTFPDVAPALPLSDREVALISILRAKSDRLVDLQRLRAPARPTRGLVGRVGRAVRRRVGRRLRRAG